ncbi:hypothetical protein LY76DRAFT_591736 [Colletotrichum caudatum]|nr:hypothetical protein LY76DRAFT_591736 [Colletotrichum caudatum]
MPVIDSRPGQLGPSKPGVKPSSDRSSYGIRRVRAKAPRTCVAAQYSMLDRDRSETSHRRTQAIPASPCLSSESAEESQRDTDGPQSAGSLTPSSNSTYSTLSVYP